MLKALSRVFLTCKVPEAQLDILIGSPKGFAREIMHGRATGFAAALWHFFVRVEEPLVRLRPDMGSGVQDASLHRLQCAAVLESGNRAGYRPSNHVLYARLYYVSRPGHTFCIEIFLLVSCISWTGRVRLVSPALHISDNRPVISTPSKKRARYHTLRYRSRSLSHIMRTDTQPGRTFFPDFLNFHDSPSHAAAIEQSPFPPKCGYRSPF